MIAEAPIRVRQAGSSSTDVTPLITLALSGADVGYRPDVFRSRDSGSNDAREDVTTKLRFFDLAEVWHSETDYKSLDRQRYSHPAYLRIVEELGKAAIPFILQDLRDRHGRWFAALRQLSGDPSVDAGARSPKEAEIAWLRWGRTQGYSL